MQNQNNSSSDKSIGDIIGAANNLSPENIQAVLAYQKEHGVKFGEAAVRLGYVKKEDVLWALSQQFHYPYTQSSNVNVNSELIVAGNPFSEASEVFRDLRSQLIANVFSGEKARRALAVVSPNVGDGKSFFVANIAASFSQLGGRTLIVDADMRTPRQHEVFGVNNSVGLSGILSGRSETNVIRPIADLPSLYLLPVGVVPPNPLELVQHPSFGLLMKELLTKFEYIIVDTPAASHGSDSRVIAAVCGAALIVGRKGVTEMKGMEKLVGSIQHSSTEVVGVVMNDH
jgi:protein-tyrosine kinase